MRFRIAIEVGHTVSARSKVSAEGYTHIWELFVRGIDGAHIERYVDKVVYTLHDSFPRPVQSEFHCGEIFTAPISSGGFNPFAHFPFLFLLLLLFFVSSNLCSHPGAAV